jgi:oxygen-independent coproporphyrinogen-3 oxidase
MSSAEETTVGNYFVSNYPPFSFWNTDQVPAALAALDRPVAADKVLGLYAHIPFCRKRCDFCYFKVYTQKNSRDIERYLDSVLRELDSYAEREFVSGRTPSFVYFGGGTPSYLSEDQMKKLFGGLQERLSWSGAREVAFECEPGTLSERKIRTLRELGVTRLSLGVENFNPDILELNNRAHRAAEIFRTYGFARDAGFPQINIDLIAGMVGETEENWRACIERTLELQPDSVTIYQMEVPYNTTIYQRMKDGGSEVAPVADWETKRRWTAEAFAQLEAGGYSLGSAYTASRNPDVEFLYRDALWRGADMIGLGVASFSHVGGVHFQNEHALEPYEQRVAAGELPIHRAYELSDEERLVREFVLQMKLGEVGTQYFQDRFGVDVRARFGGHLAVLEQQNLIAVDGERIRASREGLLRIDTLLEGFFLDEHRGARYA